MAFKFGKTVGNVLGFDPTPNFQLTKDTGGSVPFIGRDAASLASQSNTFRGNDSALNTLLSGSRNPTTSGGGNVLGANTQQSGAFTGAADGGAQAASDAAERNAALYGIDSGLNTANDGLGRLDNQLNTGLGNIGRDYESAYGRLMGQKQYADADFNTNKTNQLNQYQGARNQSAANARNFMETGQRTLGAAGAGGGSAARFAVPNQAQQMAAQGNAQAQSTNNRNLTSLFTENDRRQAEFNNGFNDLTDQRTRGENDYRGQIESQRAELTNQIGQLTGQRTLANGGDFRAAQAAAAPYTSRVQSILSQIDGLAATPRIAERQVALNRPDLAGYEFARPEAQPIAQQDPTLSNPLLALLGQQDEQQLQPAF